jgi:transposase
MRAATSMWRPAASLHDNFAILWRDGFVADVSRSALPLRLVETIFAVDSTGFSSNKFVKWYDHKYGRERSEHAWLKLHAVVGVKSNVVVAAQVLDKDSADSPQFKALLEKTTENFHVGDFTADKAYLSHDNLGLVDALGATPLIPFKTNSTCGEPGSLWAKMYGYFTYRREDFLRRYHQRSNIESSFSAIKRLFGDAVRSKSAVAMRNEVLCKLVAFNLTCVIHEQEELGIGGEFWREEPVAEAPRAVLRFPGVG